MNAQLDDARLRRYLLAELSADERDEFEAAFFEDDTLQERLELAEDELVDDFVTGALSASERQRFSQHYLTTPERHRRATFARALQHAIVEMPAPGAPERTSAFDAIAAFLGMNPRRFALALSAATLVVVVGSTILWERSLFRPPAGTIALNDTTGPVALTAERPVALAAHAALPQGLARAVRELVTTGSILDPALAKELDALRVGATQGDVRSRTNGPSAATPALTGPSSTAVRNPQPTLRWEAVPGARDYRVAVADRSRKVLWESRTGGATEAAVPPGLLQRAQGYFWEVQALTDGDSPTSAPAGFWVIDEDAEREVQDVEQNYRESALALAATYDKHGLLEEALAQVEALEKLNPGRPEVQAILSRLRLQLGRQ